MEADHHSTVSDMLRGIPPTPPRPLSLLPGLSYRSVIGKSFIFPILFFALCFLMILLMIFSVDKEARLPFIDMEQAAAQVIHVSESSKCNSNSKELHYSFHTSEGRTYYGETTVCEGSVYFNIEKGDMIPIVYDPDQPSFNGIEGIIGRNQPPIAIFFMFPFLFLLIFLPLFWPDIKQHNNARKIFKKGIIAKGKVVFIKRKGGTSFFYFWPFTKFQIFYRYRSQDGSLVESSVISDNDWIVNKLDFGSTVQIAFLETKPKKSIILDCYVR